MKALIRHGVALAFAATASTTSMAWAQAPAGATTSTDAQSTAPADEQPPAPVRVNESVVVIGGVKTPKPIDTLGAVSEVSRDVLDTTQADSTEQLFRSVPGMSAALLGDDAATVINVRGMQDNGRVIVWVDGARQDFSRPAHAGYGSFFLDPDLLSTLTVVRGPSAGASGGIGGAINFQTLSPSDLLLGDQRVAVRQKVGYDSNGSAPMSSTTSAVRFGTKFAILGNFVARHNGDFTDGAGQRILYSESQPKSGLVKGVITPTANQLVTLSYTGYRNDFLSSRQAGNSSPTLSVDQTGASNDALTGRWAYTNPTNRLVDFVVGAFSTKTTEDQIKVKGTATTIGQTRGYTMKTSGFNASNVSRGTAFGMRHALTVGVDAFHDVGSTTDIANGNGTRTATGVFGQWDATYHRLQLIASLRHDSYELSGKDKTGAAASSSRGGTSPRVTGGVTLLPGLTAYATYVEGFRAPAIYEIFGIYASASQYQLGLNLLPERARGNEAGVNFTRRNLFANSQLDVKWNVYNTKVNNFITGQLVNGVGVFNNIAAARLKGNEVDTSLSGGWGYVSLNGSLGRAVREGGQYDGLQLSNAPLNRVIASFGLNSFERKLHYGLMVMHIDAKARNTASFPTAPVSDPYTVSYLFASYKVSSWLDARFNVDNLFNAAFNDPEAQYTTTGPTSFQGRGRTVKFSLTTRFGG